MSLKKKLSELFLPLTAIGGFVGVIQDIVSPLAKIGVWTGFIFIIIGIILILIREDSKFGSFIQNISGHWKTPIVASFFVLGITTFTFSYFSSQSIKEGGKGVLVDNVKVLSVLQKDLLGLQDSVHDIKIVTTDTNKIVKDSAVVLNKTSENVDVILENTNMTATKMLLEKGYSISNHDDFFRAIDELDGDSLKEVLSLFNESQFLLSRKVKIFPDLFSDNNKRNRKLLRMPKHANVIHGLVYLNYPIEKILTVFNIFKGSENLVTPKADWYAEQSINPIIGANYRGVEVFHPQGLLGGAESSFNKSLISYPRNRNQIETTKRGEYSLIHTAAAMGDIELLSVLLDRGHDINKQTVSGYTALALAIENEQISVAKYLLDSGVDVSINGHVAFEIALLKMIEGYYPLIGASGPVHAKRSLGFPKNNPYYKISSDIRKKISSKPEDIIVTVNNLYSKQVNVFRKLLKEQGDYTGSIYKARISLGEDYIEALQAL